MHTIYKHTRHIPHTNTHDTYAHTTTIWQIHLVYIHNQGCDDIYIHVYVRVYAYTSIQIWTHKHKNIPAHHMDTHTRTYLGLRIIFQPGLEPCERGIRARGRGSGRARARAADYASKMREDESGCGRAGTAVGGGGRFCVALGDFDFRWLWVARDLLVHGVVVSVCAWRAARDGAESAGQATLPAAEQRAQDKPLCCATYR